MTNIDTSTVLNMLVVRYNLTKEKRDKVYQEHDILYIMLYIDKIPLTPSHSAWTEYTELTKELNKLDNELNLLKEIITEIMEIQGEDEDV